MMKKARFLPTWVFLIAITACAGSTILTPTNIAEAQIAVDGIELAYNDVVSFPDVKVTPAQDAQIRGYIGAAKQLVEGLKPTTDPAAAASQLQGITSDLIQIANAAFVVLPTTGAAGPIIQRFMATVTLAKDLLKIAQTLVPANSNAAAKASPAVTIRFQNPGMSVTEATAVLKARTH